MQNENEILTEPSNEEIKEEKKLPKKKKKEEISVKFDEALYEDPKFTSSHAVKCKVSTARFFDVTIDHISNAYYIFNGKKVDGFYITQLIDRHGFSNGVQESRATLAKKFNMDNTLPIDVAENKLKIILQSSDVIKEYKDLMKDFSDDFLTNTKNNIKYGA